MGLAFEQEITEAQMEVVDELVWWDPVRRPPCQSLEIRRKKGLHGIAEQGVVEVEEESVKRY